MRSIPGSGRSPGGGNGNPLQYPCLENPMDRGAWWSDTTGTNTHTLKQYSRLPGGAEIARLKRQGGREPGLAWVEALVPSENKLPPSDHFSRGLQLPVTHPSLPVRRKLRNTQFKRSPVNKSIGKAFGEHVQGELPLPLTSLFPGAVLLGTGKGTNEPPQQEIKVNTKQKQK